ncbi:hypothetical protein [Flexithrix dorotheae]|uniref:hypothetical protein n=1 Tax=Flexithrix dorotheae TaxID=70993 RepID=UPI0003692D34|nr:hypothetical protein [Flexithrix dorotheae]
MKTTKFPQPLKLLLIPALFIMIFTNCTKETEEEIAPEEHLQVTEDAKAVEIAPTESTEPKNDLLTTEPDNLVFPDNGNSNARISSYGPTDYVDFHDKMALTIIPDNARNTFTFWPYYIQKIGTGWVHVKENDGANYNEGFRSEYNHYHLTYQHFEPCFLSSGNFGKPSGSSCLNFDPTLQNRELFTHSGDHWIKVYVYDYENPSRKFDLLEIKVVKGPIQLWFKEASGGWKYWQSLGVGRWNLSNYCKNIKEVLISGQQDFSPIGIDDLKIKVPYY